MELKDIDGKSRVAATVDDIMLTFDFNIMTAFVEQGPISPRFSIVIITTATTIGRLHRAPPATACYFGVLRACCAIVQSHRFFVSD